jgi:hypothetical protein
VKNCLPPREPPPKWIRYEAQSWLVLALRLQPLAELAHRRLADLCWSGAAGDLDTGPETAELCKVPRKQWPSVLRQLRAAGWQDQNGSLTHPDVLRSLAEAEQLQHERERAIAFARTSRWPKRTPAAQPVPAAPGEPLSQSQSHSQSQSLSQPVTVNGERLTENLTLNVEPAERLTLSPSALEKASPGEGRFMARLLEVFASCGTKAQESELTNWGGWWRNRYREDPKKADRVLAELRSMLKEHRVRRNPGGAAMDLWKRFAPSAG